MKKVKRYYRIRSKICNTGVAMLLITLFLALITCYKPEYWPAFAFTLIITVLTLIPAFYIETVEREV